MRWTGLVLAVLVIGLAEAAAGGQPGCANCNGGGATGLWAQSWLYADAGAGPACYCLVPGCCEETRHCCDNAWAGYCEHRARVDAWWARVGTPDACTHSRPCRKAPMGRCSTCAPCSGATMQPTPATGSPTPAAAPVPPPVPIKGAWNASTQSR
jgi:hypothetical protein